MSGKNSFDQLATEIIFEIFDYLSYNDIIYTFLYLNQRFHSMLLQYSRFLNHFATPTRNFSFWQYILSIISSRIECLIITIPDFSLSLDLFPNLKSVIISSSLSISHDQLNIMLKCEQFKKLTSFKVKREIVSKKDVDEKPLFNKKLTSFKVRSEIVSKKGVDEEPLFNKILNTENCLHTFEYLPEQYDSFQYRNHLNISVNLRSLSLKIFDVNRLLSLLNYTPNLKYLNIILQYFDSVNRFKLNTDLSHIKLKKLSIVSQRDRIGLGCFLRLTSFIRRFSSSLNYLSLEISQMKTYESRFNGLTFQIQLLESMIELKSFHLYMQLGKEPRDSEHFLSTFQTQFWFDHHWTFGMHGIYLYTLPFHFDKLNDFIDFNRMKSTDSKILNSPQTWSHVESIDFSEFFQFKSNVIEQIKLKMPNLTTATISYKLMHNIYTNGTKINETGISLDSVTTIHCVGEHFQDRKHLLIHIFPNTRNVMLSYTSAPVASSSFQEDDDYFCDKWMTTDYIYSSKIEYVEIKMTLERTHCLHEHVIYLAKELVQMFKNLQSFIFHFYDKTDFLRRSGCIDYELDTTIRLLNTNEISRKYQIKHIHNSFQFIRKES